MTPEHAKMQGLTYAWGREDASRAVTPVSAYTFAEAFAQPPGNAIVGTVPADACSMATAMGRDAHTATR